MCIEQDRLSLCVFFLMANLNKQNTEALPLDVDIQNRDTP